MSFASAVLTTSSSVFSSSTGFCSSTGSFSSSVVGGFFGSSPVSGSGKSTVTSSPVFKVSSFTVISFSDEFFTITPSGAIIFESTPAFMTSTVVPAAASFIFSFILSRLTTIRVFPFSVN